MVFNKAITGTENCFDAGSPQAALVDFYHAFNNTSMEKMTANWCQTEQASMSNPLGGVRRGWHEIASVYERIFNGSARVYVEFYDYSIHQSAQFFCAVGKERGYFIKSGQKLDLAIRTSRVYQWQDEQWLQLHHHGSIDSAKLLQAYQSAVIKK